MNLQSLKPAATGNTPFSCTFSRAFFEVWRPTISSRSSPPLPPHAHTFTLKSRNLTACRSVLMNNSTQKNCHYTLYTVKKTNKCSSRFHTRRLVCLRRLVRLLRLVPSRLKSSCEARPVSVWGVMGREKKGFALSSWKSLARLQKLHVPDSALPRTLAAN